MNDKLNTELRLAYDVLKHHKETSERRWNTIQRLYEENRTLKFALQVANDCLFGNTHDDIILDEAYKTVHDALYGE